MNIKYLRSRTYNQGFTLQELLVVIAIIGILATITTYGMRSLRIKSNDAKRKADLQAIDLAINNYYPIEKVYPSSESTPAVLGFATLNTFLISAGYTKETYTDPVNSGDSVYRYTVGGTGYTKYETSAKFQNQGNKDIKQDCILTTDTAGTPTNSCDDTRFEVGKGTENIQTDTNASN